MAQGFAATVDAWCKAVPDRNTAVFRESVQRVVRIAQQTRSEGGNMPVLDGFLRASVIATLDGSVPPMTFKPEGDSKYAYSSSVVALVIANATTSDEIVIAWTASYARPREYGTKHMSGAAFLGLAAQQWPQIVAQVQTELQSRPRG